VYLRVEFRASPLIRQWKHRWGLLFKITPQPLYPRQRATVPNVQEVGWAQSRFGLVRSTENNLFAWGFKPRTVQPVARVAILNTLFRRLVAPPAY
jgi:hypothetical protein